MAGAGALAWRADQFFINTDGEAFNGRAGFHEAAVLAEDAGLKVEEDHELVWLVPDDALGRPRHDARAWAVAAWLRREGGSAAPVRRAAASRLGLTCLSKAVKC